MTNTTATRYFGRCDYVSEDGRRCGARIVIETTEHPMAECTDRGHYGQLHFRMVKSTLAPQVTCDAKCHEAISENCKCSCGGSNHGQLPARKL